MNPMSLYLILALSRTETTTLLLGGGGVLQEETTTLLLGGGEGVAYHSLVIS
jgi:hypothetical protein